MRIFAPPDPQGRCNRRELKTHFFTASRQFGEIPPFQEEMIIRRWSWITSLCARELVPRRISSPFPATEALRSQGTKGWKNSTLGFPCTIPSGPGALISGRALCQRPCDGLPRIAATPDNCGGTVSASESVQNHARCAGGTRDPKVLPEVLEGATIAAAPRRGGVDEGGDQRRG